MLRQIRTGLMATVFFACTAGNALAQSTVGEVLDKGGKFLTSVELKELLTGTTMSGRSRSGNPYLLNLNADGSARGSLTYMESSGRHRNDTITGTWMVNDKNRYCQTTVSNGAKADFCQRVLTAGGEYFFVETAGERDAKVSKREIKKQ